MARIAIVAGELSGDALGGNLIAAIRRERPDVRFEGIGGPAMRAAGCTIWRDSSALAVMGLFEVLRHLPRLVGVYRELLRRLVADPPDLFIGIDAPDFNLRVEQRLKTRGLRTVHYVSPSVWAWRPGRVEVLKRACDQVLCLLPFEADFLEAHGVPATFVGHPLADRLNGDTGPDAGRRALGLRRDAPVVAVLPGSRFGEVSRLGPVFAGAAAWLDARSPGISYVVPAATSALSPLIREQWRTHAPDVSVRVVDGDAHTALRAADAVLVASGTATLETMLINRPMVVAYRLSPLTWQLLGRLRLVKVAHVALPNLLAGERLVPELLQDAATPAALGQALQHWLQNPAEVSALQARFTQLGATLRRDAGARAATAVLRCLPAPYNPRPDVADASTGSGGRRVLRGDR
jgi:lipid-A-disaccharide synthase